MARTKTVQKTAFMWHLGPKGYWTGHYSTGSLERGFVGNFVVFSPTNAERMTIKTFLEVTLVSLTFRVRTVF